MRCESIIVCIIVETLLGVVLCTSRSSSTSPTPQSKAEVTSTIANSSPIASSSHSTTEGSSPPSSPIPLIPTDPVAAIATEISILNCVPYAYSFGYFHIIGKVENERSQTGTDYKYYPTTHLGPSTTSGPLANHIWLKSTAKRRYIKYF